MSKKIKTISDNRNDIYIQLQREMRKRKTKQRKYVPMALFEKPEELKIEANHPRSFNKKHKAIALIGIISGKQL